MAVLEVKNLRVRFETHQGTVQAVDEVSLRIDEGETLGLVGESGSGKSVTSLALMGLIPTPPGVIESGEVWLDGQNLLTLGDREMQRVRGNTLAMIFQDPMTSLNPFLTVGRQLTEVLELHKGLSHLEARRQCAQGLGDVGIPNPEGRLDAYPHELSGGMRQRVMIAMGLLCKPKVLIADEPTTALDVTIQAQILELMGQLQEKHGTSILLITHDLGVVAGTCDRVHVMYAGRLVETGTTERVFNRPLHPYTLGLLRSVPTLGSSPDEALASVAGQPPDLADLPKGCAFGPRCEFLRPKCKLDRPPLASYQDTTEADAASDVIRLGGRRSACYETERVITTHPEGDLA